ncbi:MAG: hypothetical protein N4A72_01890 [Bacteroidales bacterium]|jgi:hypothetical protein|nr:hypothetical protein [Bacteroidales bacterium]
MRTNNINNDYKDSISDDKYLSDIIDDLISESLDTDNSFIIPDNFADSVCKKISERAAVRERFEKLMFILGVWVLLPIIATLILYYFKVDFITSVISFGIEYKYPLLFAIICFILIQTTDILVFAHQKKSN